MNQQDILHPGQNLGEKKRQEDSNARAAQKHQQEISCTRQQERAGAAGRQGPRYDPQQNVEEHDGGAVRQISRRWRGGSDRI